MKRGIAMLVVTGCGLTAVGQAGPDGGGADDASATVTDGGVTVLPDGAIVPSDGASDVVVPPTCDGPCLPVAIAENQKEPQGLAIDGSNVYWTNTGALGDVELCPKTGCPTAGPHVLAVGLASPNAVLAAGGLVFWTNYGASTLQSCAIGGCGQTPTTVATMSPLSSGFGRLAADATTLFFTDAGNGKVHSCSLQGCGGPPAILGQAQVNVWGIAVDDTRIYFVNDAVTGTVDSCPKSGCGGSSNNALTTLASNQGNPRTVAIDATHVYWVTQTGGTVMRCAKTGCNGNPETLASGLLNPHGVAVDDTFVYFTERTTNSVKKVPKAGGATPTIVADNQMNPFNVAVDANAIYWTNWVALGQVMKLQK